MAITQCACRIHAGANDTMTVYIKKELAGEVKKHFPTKRDLWAVFDPESKTLTISPSPVG